MKQKETSPQATNGQNENGTAPEYYGHPVMICGVENANEEGEREVITISSNYNLKKSKHQKQNKQNKPTAQRYLCSTQTQRARQESRRV